MLRPRLLGIVPLARPLRPVVANPLLTRYTKFIAHNSSVAGPPKSDPKLENVSEAAKPENLSADSALHIESAEDVEKTTGIIETEARQGLLYYDHMFSGLARISVINRLVKMSPFGSKERIASRIVDMSFPKEYPLELINVVPRERDGGVFATYQVNSGHDNSSAPLKEIQEAIQKKQAETNYRPWFTGFCAVRAFPVKGVPWIEDLRRFTTNKLKVIFEGPDLTSEDLYSILRRYGPLIDIEPPPPGTKDVPRSSIVTFTSYADAATARNCVTGLTVRETKIHLTFQPLNHQNVIKEWVVGHPRLVIPIVVALLAALTVVIFEPIRVWMVQRKIHGVLPFEEYALVRYLRRVTDNAWSTVNSYIGSSHSMDSSSDALWDERVQSVETLRQWIEEGVGTFIVVSGPRGGGKEDLVLRHTLKGRNDILHLDCDVLLKTRTDSAFLKAAAKELGYAPVFPWKNTIANFLDVIAQGLSGQKTGFAESTDTQFKNMLNTAAVAIHNTALQFRDSKSEQTDEEFLLLHPESRPVVVISSFMGRTDGDDKKFIYKQLTEWAASLIQTNTAHIIFISSDVGHDKVLSEALPSQVFKTLAIGDASAESARKFVLRQLAVPEAANPSSVDATGAGTSIGASSTPTEKEESIDLKDLDAALAPLGGRMTDLQAFTRRLKSGETVSAALSDMVDQSAVEILQMFLMRDSADWTREQAWVLVKELANVELGDSHGVPFGQLAQNSNFKSRDQQKALYALEHSELISTHSVGGRIISVRPGKPIYHAAFHALARDRTLIAEMESQIVNAIIAKEDANIKSYETELHTLSKLPGRWETKLRIDYLMGKLSTSQVKIIDLEKKLDGYQQIVAQLGRPSKKSK